MRPELDHPGRTTGSLCAHYRHQRIDDFDELLKRVGEQDLTAHVDFSQLCSEAERAGFQVNGLVTQARFLINVGILESAQNILDQTADTISRTRHQQALHQLLSEPEMGERFKVMLLTKNLDSARRQTLIEKGFLAGDRLGK
jgi:SAM-dependent MidA family methyltransferase